MICNTSTILLYSFIQNTTEGIQWQNIPFYVISWNDSKLSFLIYECSVLQTIIFFVTVSCLATWINLWWQMKQYLPPSDPVLGCLCYMYLAHLSVHCLTRKKSRVIFGIQDMYQLFMINYYMYSVTSKYSKFLCTALTTIAILFLT